MNKQIINFKFDSDSFEFIYRWANGVTGNIFKCYSIGDNRFHVDIGKEESDHEISIRGNAIDCNSILSLDNNVSEILWFDQDNNTYKETELR